MIESRYQLLLALTVTACIIIASIILEKMWKKRICVSEFQVNTEKDILRQILDFILDFSAPVAAA